MALTSQCALLRALTFLRVFKKLANPEKKASFVIVLAIPRPTGLAVELAADARFVQRLVYIFNIKQRAFEAAMIRPHDT